MATTTQTNLSIVGNRQNLRDTLAKDNVTDTLRRVSTRWLNADQLKTQAMIAVARNPKLLKCTRASLIESVVRAGELGLRFAGASGEAYLVPFKNECALIVGYRGLCALARRTGKVTRIEARTVHEKDFFKLDFGSGQQLIHRPHIGADRGLMVCVYALAEFRGGEIQIEVMSKDEVDAIRKRSRAAADGPWVTDYLEMARKSCLRRLCKFLPFPTAFEDALIDEDTDNTPDNSRKSVNADEVPANVDVDTGEIIDVPEDISDEQEEIRRDISEDDEGAVERKSEIGNRILEVINELYPGDSIEADSARLKELRFLYGKSNFVDILRLPESTLVAGLKILEGKLNVNVNE